MKRRPPRSPLFPYTTLFRSCWTPPHFWALSLQYRDDYAAAGIPMLPVARGVASAARQILAYTLVVVAVTLLLFRFEAMGLVYLVAAVGLGAAFPWQAFGLKRDAPRNPPMRRFAFSNAYLALLFPALPSTRSSEPPDRPR